MRADDFDALFAVAADPLIWEQHPENTRHQRKGEMKRLMLRHAFPFVRRVIFVVGAENWRSRRAVEKIGGTRARTAVGRGGYPVIVFEITADAFRS